MDGLTFVITGVLESNEREEAMCYEVIILSEYNLSWVHPGAFVQLTDDINTCFLIPTFRDTFF